MYKQNKKTVLSGTVQWAGAPLCAFDAPEATGDLQAVGDALARRLLPLLRAQAPDSWQQLIHYLATEALIDAQREADEP